MAVLIGLLFVGDRLSSARKERVFKTTAESIISEYKIQIENLVYADIDSQYLSESREIIKILEKGDELIPRVSIIFKDTISSLPVYVEISSRVNNKDRKSDLIFQTNPELRKYLASVFDQGRSRPYFKRKDDWFRYFHPIKLKNKTAVLMFNEYSRYGKFGS